MDNVYLNALEYTGYKVQAQKNDGTIFKTYGYRATAYLSNISYGLVKYGTETVTKSGTATGLAPDIAGFASSGLCCASYVSYVYYNYLPNIAGIDTSAVARPSNPRSASSYNAAANDWVNSGTARRISFTQSSSGDNFVPSENIPIGSLVVFRHIPTGEIAHVAVYAGYYDGNHFVTHVGNDRGPEISTIDGMSKGDYPEAVVQVVVPQFVDASGKIEVYKKDTNSKDLSGAIFTVYNSDGRVVTTIGPTNSSGYASKDGITYGSYRVVETTFPKNYKENGPTEWNVKLSDSNNGLIVINAKNELKKGHIEIIKSDAEDGRDLSGAEFTVYDTSGKMITVIGPTDSSGYAKSEEIYYGTYRVLETKIPENYQLGKVKEWPVTIDDDNNGLITLDITNDRQYGSIKIIKSAEDNYKQGFQFRLTGTSVYGDYIDMTVATDMNGIALFDPVPIGTGYVLSEVNTDVKYVVPADQEADVEWDKVTEREFDNILKKWRAEVYKLDDSAKSPSGGDSIGAPQGDATLAGAVYGVFKSGQLIDTYTTDANGHFITDYYICDTDWTIREISPSEGLSVGRNGLLCRCRSS